MFVRGGNFVRMDIGKILSNKIFTVTDVCVVKVNKFSWCDSLFGDFLSVVQLFFLSDFSFIKTM